MVARQRKPLQPDETKPKVVQVRYTASPTMAKFHQSSESIRGIKGPIGSGKSVACCFEILSLAMQQYPNEEGIRKSRTLIVRNTMPELLSTTLKTWLDWFPEGNPDKDPTKFGELTRRSPYTHHMRFGLPDGTRVENEVIFLALDQADDIKKLLSLECSVVWFNEARYILKEHVDAARGRIGRYPSAKDGGCRRPSIIMDTNPPDDTHWWYQLAEVVKPEGMAFFDQPSGLSEEAENLENLLQTPESLKKPLPERRDIGRRYYQQLIAGTDPEWVNVYVHGKYGFIKEGQPVFKGVWSGQIHRLKTAVPLDTIQEVHVGIDCSGRHPAAVFLTRGPFGEYDVVHELCITDDDGMSARRFARLLAEELRLRFPKARISNPIWGDPAGNNRSQNDDKTYFDILNDELRSFSIRVKASPGFRLPERLQSVETLLTTLVNGRPKLMVSPACAHLLRGFDGGYKYKKISTAGETRFDSEPMKNRYADVHDALQYVASGVCARLGGLKTTRPKYQAVNTSGWLL